MRHSYAELLHDRRVMYRDRPIVEAIMPHRQRLQELLSLLVNASESLVAAPMGQLTATSLRSMKLAWLSKSGVAMSSLVPNGTAISMASAAAGHKSQLYSSTVDFYAALLSSTFVKSDADIRLILGELQQTDLLNPSAAIYEAIFLSLWCLEDAKTKAGQESESQSNPSSPPSVVGERQALRRSVVGDLAGYYMGYALAQPLVGSGADEIVAQCVRPVTPQTWSVFFSVLAATQAAPKLMDLWWEKFLDFMGHAHNADYAGLPDGAMTEEEGKNKLEKDVLVMNGAVTASSSRAPSGSPAPTAARCPLPYQAIHAVLSWCAGARDIERVLRYYHASDQRGVTAPLDLNGHYPDGLQPTQLIPSGGLTTRSNDTKVQQLQLALLAKLMATVKSIKMDGGMRGIVVKDIQRLIDEEVLYSAPWGVVNDVLSGLSTSSGMALLRQCSTEFSPASVEAADTSESPDSKHRSEQRRRPIPFYIWASFLRRCCHSHYLDEAESLFLFLRKAFPLSSSEKRELVEIMLRMYATLRPPNFCAMLDLFLQHVVRTPDGEAEIAVDATMYELLIKGADSRNAGMMIFLEACAAGTPMTPELFEALMGTSQCQALASLSRKLPNEYTSSSLDEQLKIPANVDAHLRREEALRARGKPSYDSTGDAI